MKTKLKTAPAATPVSLADMKSYLKVDETAEDAVILSLINAATEKVEELIDKKLINQTWLIALDAPPVRRKKCRNDLTEGIYDGAIGELFDQSTSVEFPFGCLQSLEGLVATHSDGSTETIPAANFDVDTFGVFGKVALKDGYNWPSDLARYNGLVFEAVFGYGADATAVPEAIKTAIKLIVGKMFEDRGDDVNGEMGGKGSVPVPLTAESLLLPYTVVKVGYA